MIRTMVLAMAAAACAWAAPSPAAGDVGSSGRRVDPVAEELFLEAYQRYQEGRIDESTALFERVVARGRSRPIAAIAAYNIACNQARKGDLDASVRWLDRALAAGYDNLFHMGRDPDLAQVRLTAGYEELRRGALARPPRPRASVDARQIPQLARRIADAVRGERSPHACFSRLGWFAHDETAKGVEAELARLGLRLENQAGNWTVGTVEED
jgi:hypothetical protein